MSKGLLARSALWAFWASTLGILGQLGRRAISIPPPGSALFALAFVGSRRDNRQRVPTAAGAVRSVLVLIVLPNAAHASILALMPGQLCEACGLRVGSRPGTRICINLDGDRRLRG